jgi:hypothetical protein
MVDLSIFKQDRPCPRCGKLTQEGDAFCKKCGHALRTDGVEGPVKPWGLSDREKKMLIIMIPILLVVLYTNFFMRTPDKRHSPPPHKAPVSGETVAIKKSRKDSVVFQVARYLVMTKGAAQIIKPLEWGQVKTFPDSRYAVRCKYKIIQRDGQSTLKDDLFFLNATGHVVFLMPME